ncbi:MAG: DPP IV N-terminal domain-containing protein [Bacteroidota bacterium]|nr:DPP IV N-terminal domain-containing protein [Bacteroidota bacterium]
MKKCLFYLALLFNALSYNLSNAQQKKEISLEDIFVEKKFNQNSVSGINWMKDGLFYTSLVADKNGQYIIKYNITTGSAIDTLVDSRQLNSDNASFSSNSSIDDYQLSSDEAKILLATNMQSVYRRSFIAEYFIYDLKTKALKPLSNKNPQSYATFSPDGKKVAYVRDNNLFYVGLDDKIEHEITKTGKTNHIIHGSADWVYEEEFSLTKAFEWSPDGKKIAYMTFDETDVKEYNMQLWGGLYPYDYKFKYPKAGEKNAVISIAVYNVSNKLSQPIAMGDDPDVYIPRILWTNSPDVLSIIKLNRTQNKLDILHANVQTGTVQVLLTEESKTYVDINENDTYIYLSDNKSFLLTSEKDGFKHIYHYSIDGKELNQVTSGPWEVSAFVGIDEKRNLLYYTSTEVSPLERHLYSIKLNGKSKKKMTTQSGINSVNFSPDFNYYINFNTSLHSPVNVTLHQAPSSKKLKTLQDNQSLRDTLQNYVFGTTEFFTFPSDGFSLNAYMLKPANFDASKKYPVLMYVYGGPGDQRVLKNYYGTRELWHHYLSQKGYIVAVIDNRGTGGRGREFKHLTYMNLGKHEVEDQIEGAKFVSSLPYVDGSRIGIWGWSYGGYMSSLALLLGQEHFKMAIAVAPVTNWRFYDTIYTERYLRTPHENPSGYDDFSPLSHAEKLEGAYLLIHGTGDDNVHFQNAVAMEEVLIEAGKQFKTFYYPNKSHSISGKNTSIHLYTLMWKFIEREL